MKKKSVLFCLMVFLLAYSFAQAAPISSKGDMNNDGKTDLADSLIILQIAAGMRPELGVDYSGYWGLTIIDMEPGVNGYFYTQFIQAGNYIFVVHPMITFWCTLDGVNISCSAWTDKSGKVDFTGTLQGNVMSAASGTLLAEKVIGGVEDTLKPTVLSTVPANGAVGVNRNISQISIEFSERMLVGRSISSNGPWSLSNNTIYSWSSDNKTLYESRDNTGLLPAQTTIQFTLNPTNYSPGFRDVAGNPLDPYTFSFTTGN